MSALSDDDIHAYVDGVLDPGQRAEIERRLAEDGPASERVAAYRRNNAALRAAYQPLLEAPVPTRLRRAGKRAPRWLLRYAAAIGWLALGGLLGWFLHATSASKQADAPPLAKQAAIAHAVYVPEVRHPVEVGAEQHAHLVGWLSKRLGASLKTPNLAPLGFDLVGGRLLPGSRGPVAQFMYQDSKGQRLTLYVRTDNMSNRETAFRFSQEGNIGVFYWLDGKFGYALSGELEKGELLRVATAVYRQLNP